MISSEAIAELEERKLEYILGARERTKSRYRLSEARASATVS